MRPPWGGHPRVAIYGLLEARMSRADLVICAGLNEGHLAGDAGARSAARPGGAARARRAGGGFPHRPCRARSRRRARRARSGAEPRGARCAGPGDPLALPAAGQGAARARLARSPSRTRTRWRWPARSTMPHRRRAYPRPAADARAPSSAGCGSASPRSTGCAAIPTSSTPPRSCGCSSSTRSMPSRPRHGAAPRRTRSSRAGTGPAGRWPRCADEVLDPDEPHPLMRALWRPRLLRALEWVEAEIAAASRADARRCSRSGASMVVRGIEFIGRADRIDRLRGRRRWRSSTTRPASRRAASRSSRAIALQLGTIGLMAERGGFEGLAGRRRAAFEYWSLAKSKKSETGFGYVATPILDRQQAQRHSARRIPAATRRTTSTRRSTGGFSATSRSPRGSTPMCRAMTIRPADAARRMAAAREEDGS